MFLAKKADDLSCRPFRPVIPRCKLLLFTSGHSLTVYVSRRLLRATFAQLGTAVVCHRRLQYRSQLLWPHSRVSFIHFPLLQNDEKIVVSSSFCRSVSVAGLLSVVRWLLLRDIECVIFLPVVYNNPTNMNSSHVHLLSKIEELGLVTFTPARASRGKRKAFINYDDLYLMTMANRHGGCILSGDKFKDILDHPSYGEFHELISSRVIDIRFLFLTHDVVQFGDDIFFRAAPELYLRLLLSRGFDLKDYSEEDVSTRARSIAEKIFCSPDDPLFSRVQARRAGFISSRRKELLNACDDLIYDICEREGIRPLRLSSLPAIQVASFLIQASLLSAGGYGPTRERGDLRDPGGVDDCRR